MYLTDRFFWGLALLAMLYLLAYFIPWTSGIATLVLIVLPAVLLIDIGILYGNKNGLEAKRSVSERLSNGDDNRIQLSIKNNYLFRISIEVIDEIPVQFQIRDFSLDVSLKPGEDQILSYKLCPKERGEYRFGYTLLYGFSAIGLIRRRFRIGEPVTVPVYPSFIQMRKFELLAFSNRSTEVGIKKIRKIGHTMEFDQIMEYVPGDDVRAINWKATARAENLMVNRYQDERSQQVVNVIDTGRVMKMPFEGMHLLDYAINTSLVISNIVLLKDDRAGLVTFTNRGTSVVRPEKKRTHIRRIQESLYNVTTNFLESDYRQLLISLRRNINRRSLILLYTNFESLSSMERQLPYLRQISKNHLLVVIFFENTELSSLLESDPENVREIYTKTVAEKFSFEKRQIVKTLNSYGIQTILTPPENLSVNAINKYLELKARGLL